MHCKMNRIKAIHSIVNNKLKRIEIFHFRILGSNLSAGDNLVREILVQK